MVSSCFWRKKPLWITLVPFDGMLKLVFCWCTCSKNVCSAAEGACFTSPVWAQKFRSAHQRVWGQGPLLVVVLVPSPVLMTDCLHELPCCWKPGGKEALQLGRVLAPFPPVEVILYKALNPLGCGSTGIFFPCCLSLETEPRLSKVV